MLQPIDKFITKDSLKEYIEAQFGKIVFVFEIMHFAKETDNFGYIVEKDNKRFVLLSENNRLYISNKVALEEKISEYQTILFSTKKAVTLL